MALINELVGGAFDEAMDELMKELFAPEYQQALRDKVEQEFEAEVAKLTLAGIEGRIKERKDKLRAEIIKDGYVFDGSSPDDFRTYELDLNRRVDEAYVSWRVDYDAGLKDDVLKLIEKGKRDKTLRSNGGSISLNSWEYGFPEDQELMIEYFKEHKWVASFGEKQENGFKRAHLGGGESYYVRWISLTPLKEE